MAESRRDDSPLLSWEFPDIFQTVPRLALPRASAGTHSPGTERSPRLENPSAEADPYELEKGLNRPKRPGHPRPAVGVSCPAPRAGGLRAREGRR